MTMTLNHRLARLEAAKTGPVEIETLFSPALRLLRLLLAIHLGKLRHGEDVAAGEARALGYGNIAEMRAAMATEATISLGWGSAQNAATVRLLTRHGGGQGVGCAVNREALRALLIALPAAFADHPHADPDSLSCAAEWVSA